MLMQNKKESRKLKISELSALLKIKKSTIKQWERELDLSTASSHLYSEKEILLFKKIKQLIHEESLSIKQVGETLKISIEEIENKDNSFTPAQSTTDDSPHIPEKNIISKTKPSETTKNQNEKQVISHAEIITSSDQNNKNQPLSSSKDQSHQDRISEIKSALLSIRSRLAQ